MWGCGGVALSSVGSRELSWKRQRRETAGGKGGWAGKTSEGRAAACESPCPTRAQPAPCNGASSCGAARPGGSAKAAARSPLLSPPLRPRQQGGRPCPSPLLPSPRLREGGARQEAGQPKPAASAPPPRGGERARPGPQAAWSAAFPLGARAVAQGSPWRALPGTSPDLLWPPRDWTGRAGARLSPLPRPSGASLLRAHTALQAASRGRGRSQAAPAGEAVRSAAGRQPRRAGERR